MRSNKPAVPGFSLRLAAERSKDSTGLEKLAISIDRDYQLSVISNTTVWAEHCSAQRKEILAVISYGLNR
jgi:hypothetical protein